MAFFLLCLRWVYIFRFRLFESCAPWFLNSRNEHDYGWPWKQKQCNAPCHYRFLTPCRTIVGYQMRNHHSQSSSIHTPYLFFSNQEWMTGKEIPLTTGWNSGGVPVFFRDFIWIKHVPPPCRILRTMQPNTSITLYSIKWSLTADAG